MKSSIKIDFTDNGNGLEPIIRCILVDSDDPRDKLLKSWLDGLGYDSNWAEVKITGTSKDQTQFIISPVKNIGELKDEIEERIEISNHSN